MLQRFIRFYTIWQVAQPLLRLPLGLQRKCNNMCVYSKQNSLFYLSPSLSLLSPSLLLLPWTLQCLHRFCQECIITALRSG